MREKSGFRAHFRVFWVAEPNAALAAWGSSADRTRLQADSLQTGNFTGNFAITSGPERV
jgi:hypothetical protein